MMQVATPHTSPRRKKSRWPSLGTVGAHLILGLWAVITLFPIVWIYASSVKTPEQIFEMPPKWVFKPTLHNFEVVLGLKIPTELETVTQEGSGQIQSKFPRYLLNSVIVALGSTALSLLIGAPAAYTLARHRMRGSQAILTGLILSRLVPP